MGKDFITQHYNGSNIIMRGQVEFLKHGKDFNVKLATEKMFLKVYNANVRRFSI